MRQLAVTFKNAQSVPIVDRDGVCDPYVEITTHTTQVQQARSSVE